MNDNSNDIVEKIKNNINIVELISDYVQLKKSGRNYKGLCPFHQEKTPSFTVNPENQYFHCFGCGAGGDVFTFLMDIESLTFKEALKILAERTGVEIPARTAYEKKRMKERENLFKINNLAAKFYNYILQNNESAAEAREYLNKRAFNEEDIKKFFLGYAPDNWDAIITFFKKRKYSSEKILQAGLALKAKNGRYYDRFRGRLIFPIMNSQGEVLAFGGRIISDKDYSSPKYLNSPETIIYTKGKIIYGLNWAKKYIQEKDEAIIMEGYTDVLTAHKAGINISLASLGTALTPDQARLLKRYVSNVYIAYDADTAGARATVRGLDILQEAGLNVNVIKLPEDLDPDELIRKEGSESFLDFKKSAVKLFDFKVDKILEGKNLDDTDDKVEIVREIAIILSKIKDSLKREVHLKKMAKFLQIDQEILYREVKKAEGKKDKNNINRYTKSNNKTNSSSSIIELEEIILQIFITHFHFRNYIKDMINTNYFSANNRKLADYLWRNSKLNIDIILDELEDNNIKEKITGLMVKAESEISSSRLDNIIEKFTDEYKYREKIKIYRQLNSAIDLNELNRLLESFQELN